MGGLSLPMFSDSLKNAVRKAVRGGKNFSITVFKRLTHTEEATVWLISGDDRSCYDCCFESTNTENITRTPS